MTAPDPTAFFDRFLDPGARSVATHELAAHGAEAVPVLAALFGGTARNASGRPYAEIGALDCGFVTARLLGPLARPLEPHLVAGVRRKHIYAVEALGALGRLRDESVEELARVVAVFDDGGADWNVAMEAAAALVRCGALDHPAVRAIAAGEGGAAWCLRQMADTVRRKPQG